ncbi:UPF0764 protein C16orf89 homolog [Haemaphysalis longicornis]
MVAAGASGSRLPRAALLVVAVLRANCLAAPGFGSEENRPLEWRILTALDGAVDALADSMDAMYLDAALGLRFAADHLQHLVDHATDPKGSDTRRLLQCFNMTLGDIHAVHQKAETTAVTATARVFKEMSGDAHKKLAQGLLEKGLWGVPPISASAYQLSSADEPEVIEVMANDELERRSDECLQQLFTGLNCSGLNNACWMTMTGGRQHGYALTHQALFLTIGLRLNCSARLDALALLHGQQPARRNLAAMCRRMGEDAQLISDESFPLRLRDLFLEQVASCGFMGLEAFKDPSAVEAVLSWQRDDGCYVSEYDPATEWRPRRIRREERKGKGGCSLHMTSVAAGALATFLEIRLNRQDPGLPSR